MGKTVPVTVTVPADLLKDIDRMAREARMTRSAVFTEAMTKKRWLWKLARLQTKAAGYARARGVRTEADVERILAK